MTPGARLMLGAGLPLLTLGGAFAASRPAPAPETAQVDCWDAPSCAATSAGYVVLDPTVLANSYRSCVAAANLSGKAGFATEVCEPLMPGYVEPVAVASSFDPATGCVALTVYGGARDARYCPR